MRSVLGGDGSDTTSAVAAWLSAGNEFAMANVYLIGEPEDPMALWLTDWESPLCWPIWTKEKVAPGTPNAFDPAVIKRSTVSSKIGLDVQTLTITWTPKAGTPSQSIATATPHQLAQLGFYDNWPVRVWTCYMPTPGDANTYGCSELFGGRIATPTVARNAITFKVNSWLDVVNHTVPTNVIELLNTAASYAGATPPAGFSQIPVFNVITGGSPTMVIGDCVSPSAHHIFSTNAFQRGFLVFKDGPGATLARMWSAIKANNSVNVSGTNYNQFLLYAPLPWAPTPGVDTFYVSAAAPINQADGSYYGFPYVPNPEQAA